MRSLPRLICAACFAVLSLGASCGETGIKILPGVINDPGNLTLRRELFSFGLGQLCSEMQNRSLPLKLRDDEPNIGRFFPISCQVQELTTGNLFVQFVGHGYAWSNITGRMGFEASAAVEYEHDFRVHDGALYIYFRQRYTQSSAFRPVMVERAGSGVGAAGVLGTDVQQVTQQVGERLLKHQLARGFTVVREEDGSSTFALGVLEEGQRPSVPFGRGDSDWSVLANERSDLHSGQRDYTGPYRIEDDDEALHLTVLVEGAPSIDVLLMARADGDHWIKSYETQANAPPPAAPIVFEDVVPQALSRPGAPPQPWRRKVRAAPGWYYLVLDHTLSAGRSQPPASSLDDRAASVSYAVQLGDAED